MDCAILNRQVDFAAVMQLKVRVCRQLDTNRAHMVPQMMQNAPQRANMFQTDSKCTFTCPNGVKCHTNVTKPKCYDRLLL